MPETNVDSARRLSSSRRKSIPSSTSNNNKKISKSSGFLMDLKFRNDLPNPPIDPKHIKIPSNPEKYINYHLTTLERNYQYRVHMEPVVGNPIHLIDPSTAEDSEITQIEAKDKYLIRREADDGLTDTTNSNQGSQKVSKFGNAMSLRNIADSKIIRAGKHWLRKTEYIDNNLMASNTTYLTGHVENQQKLKRFDKESKMKSVNKANISRSDIIEESFKIAKQTPVHELRPHLKPVKIFNLVPDLGMAKNQLFHVNFMDDHILDDDNIDQSQKSQIEKGRNIVNYSQNQLKTIESSILQQVHDDNSKQISFFVPALEKESTSTGKSDTATSKENDDEEKEEEDSDFGDDSDDDDINDEATKNKEEKKVNGNTSKEENTKETSISSNDETKMEVDENTSPTSITVEDNTFDPNKLKWVRDYIYEPRDGNACERFALKYNKRDLEAKGDANNIVYGKVKFCELEPIRLEMSRYQTDEFDIEESRKKRIKLERRDYTDTEKGQVDLRIQELMIGYLSDVEEEDEDDSDDEKNESDDNVKIKSKKKVMFKEDDEKGNNKSTKKNINNDDISDSSSSSSDGEEEFGTKNDSSDSDN